MKRVVSVYLPTWPTDRLRRRLGAEAPPPDVPVVVVGRQGSKRVVVGANGAAMALRLFPGVAVAQAQALTPNLVVYDADGPADGEALQRLALWALRLYSPLVAADPPDGLVMDVTGAAHLHGGEAALLEGLVTRLGESGVAARAAAATTWGAAHALARFRAAPTTVADPEEGVGPVCGLPLQALRLPPLVIEALGRLGFDTVAELDAAPRASLLHRFGPEVIRRLDEMYGRTHEPIEPVEAPELVIVRRTFAEPISAPETLARYTVKLVEALAAELEERALGARKLDLRFHRVDNRVEVVRVGAARPVRDVKRLARLLCDKLETVDPGFGIEKMVLSAPIAEPLDWRPAASDLTQPAVPEIGDLVDVLGNRLGSDRLYRVVPAESDVPERSVRKVAPLAEGTGRTWPARWPRPTRLLPRPEPIQAVAVLPDQPPVHFTWRGQRRRVRHADGPERIFGEWWRRDGELEAVRDYFQVEDEAGGRYWIFRRGDGEQPATGDMSWFIHGVFG